MINRDFQVWPRSKSGCGRGRCLCMWNFCSISLLNGNNKDNLYMIIASLWGLCKKNDSITMNTGPDPCVMGRWGASVRMFLTLENDTAGQSNVDVKDDASVYLVLGCRNCLCLLCVNVDVLSIWEPNQTAPRDDCAYWMTGVDTVEESVSLQRHEMLLEIRVQTVKAFSNWLEFNV